MPLNFCLYPAKKSQPNPQSNPQSNPMNSDKPLYAITLMIVAMICIPAGDAAGKILSNVMDVQPLFIAWSRFAIGAFFVSLFMKGMDFQPDLFRNWRIWLRALFIIGGISCILTALKTEPIANVLPPSSSAQSCPILSLVFF